MRITRSPGCTRRAAAPLMPITPLPRSPGDRVGLQAGAVGDVDDVHQLARQQVGGVEEVLVDGHRARRSAGRPGSPSPGGSCSSSSCAASVGSSFVGSIVRGRLSIRRVVPTPAAISTRPSVGAAEVGGQRRQVGEGDLEVVEVDADAPRAARRGPPSSAASTPYAAASAAASSVRCSASGLRALLGAEEAVAARQRQAVGLAQVVGAPTTSTPEAQVGGHPADQHQLLVVLLAEDGHVGAHQAEAAWPRRSARRGSGPGGCGPRGRRPSGPGSTRHLRLAAGVDLVDRRGEDDVDALARRRPRGRRRGCAGSGRGPHRRRTAAG